MTRPVKVLHILDVLRPSGAETTLAVAGPRWAERGISADVLATGVELGSYAAPLRRVGYRTGHLPMDPFTSFAPRFVELLRTEGYDAIHNHVERANVYLAGLARLAGVRVVQSLHGLFDFAGVARLERRVMRRAMRALGVRMVAVSEAVRDNERQRFGNPSQVISNWYDDQVFRPVTPGQRAAAREALGITPSATVVVSVGNCAPVKNHASLLRAVSALGRPDLVHLHAGTGDDERSEQALARELGISEQVRFLGFTDAAPLIRAADAYVMPSHREGQGIAAIEAIAMAVPVLLGDSPGLRTLTDLDPALRWALPTAAGLAIGLARLLDNPPPPEDRLRAARAASHRFGPDGPLDALAVLYRGG